MNNLNTLSYHPKRDPAKPSALQVKRYTPLRRLGTGCPLWDIRQGTDCHLQLTLAETDTVSPKGYFLP